MNKKIQSGTLNTKVVTPTKRRDSHYASKKTELRSHRICGPGSSRWAINPVEQLNLNQSQCITVNNNSNDDEPVKSDAIKNSAQSDPVTTLDTNISSTPRMNGKESPEIAKENMTNTIKITLPPFWKSKPNIWFLQVEAVFATNAVTEDAHKYNHIVSALDTSIIEEFADIIGNPPSTEMYKTLKNAIISRTTDSTEKQILKVLTGMHLGDKKPSSLWREMKTLAANTISDAAVKWLDLLPPNAAMLLRLVEKDDVAELAEVADKLTEQGGTIMAVSSNTNHNTGNTQIYTNYTELRQEIADLKVAVAQLASIIRQNAERRPRDRSNQQYRTRSSSRGRQTANSTSVLGYCWYHHKYGADAKSCKPPCKFRSDATSGNM